MSRHPFRAALAASAFAVLAVVAVGADEGFWPFHAIPSATITQRHRVTLDQAWLDHVRLSSVRFGGASGSLVSPDGLVLTNHHVALGTLGKLSTPQRDLVTNGLLAATLADELKAPDLELTVLVSFDDVTARVTGAVTPDMSDAAAADARRAVTSAVEKECQAATSLKCEVVTLYQGGQYYVYRYKRYTDVRLVFAPEYDAGFYGGDPDNFTYPRYAFDVAMFRVYENGKPARVEHYLRWSAGGARDGEPVFTSGHPGSTQRLNTVAHLEFIRDVEMPRSLSLLERRQGLLQRYGGQGQEQARQARDELFGVENSLKSRRGQLAGLNDDVLMRGKRDQERLLRDAVAKDPALAAKFGKAWDDVAAARTTFAGFHRDYTFTEGLTTLGLRAYGIALQLVRLAQESAKPDGERLSEYTDARRPSLERTLFSSAPIYLELERAKLADALTLVRETHGADHALVTAALGSATPQQRADALLAGTKLFDVAARRKLAEGGLPAIEASTDSMIVLARTLEPMARAARKRYEAEVIGVERRAYAHIAQAVFAVRGTDAYPDATSTLRLSHGSVKGYQDAGKPVAPFTQISGLYDRAAAHGDRPPYRIVPSWRGKREALNLDTAFNFVTTNDIVGGNSGSPVVNARGEVVGLVFDGNIQSLPGYFVYDAEVNRAVSVDSRAIVEALRVVYGAERIVSEILQARQATVTTPEAR